MITIYVAYVRDAEVDIDSFLQGSEGANLDEEMGERGRNEDFSIPVYRPLANLPNMAQVVIRHRYQRRVSSLELEGDQIRRVETTEDAVGFARVWIGYNPYVLFQFLGDSFGRGYPYHRLLVARSLGVDPNGLRQQFITPLDYDLPCLKINFPRDIWDQGFVRENPIQRGRISGDDIENDALFDEFYEIKGFIGITVDIKEKDIEEKEKIRVLTGGRVQFMSWEPNSLADTNTTPEILTNIFNILEEIESCSRNRVGERSEDNA